MPGHHWARGLTINKSDIEYLTGLLLEKETPLDTKDLAHALVEERLKQESDALRDRYKDAHFYNPAHSYTVGQKIIFPALDYEAAVVTDIRPGSNPDYGTFNVLSVIFEDDSLNPPDKDREFAADLGVPHKLSAEDINGANAFLELTTLTTDDIIATSGDEIVKTLEAALLASPDLIFMANKWFPKDLMLDVNIGHLNLAEAVLDIAGGGPLSSEAILQDIGGLGDYPLELQTFSLNYALNTDSRFDEVGPTGEVLWYLARLEPNEVLHTPAMLRYTPIEYDRGLLTPEMLELEAEIADEFSPLQPLSQPLYQASVVLTYPHRRLGTLPVTVHTASIFPTALKSPRVWVTLVDGQDGEEYPGWVVREDRYVLGMSKFYRKHKLPIGVYITVSTSDTPGKIIIDFKAHRPRTEWIRLIVPKNDQATFENHKRAIGAEYDDLMILGADDLAGVDALFQSAQQTKKSIFSILKAIIPALGRLTPQGTVHAKTIYSAINVLRRCPPGPIFATLAANPEFQNVGGHYWKLNSD